MYYTPARERSSATFRSPLCSLVRLFRVQRADNDSLAPHTQGVVGSEVRSMSVRRPLERDEVERHVIIVVVLKHKHHVDVQSTR